MTALRPHVDPQGATRGLAENDTAASRDRRARGALNPWGAYGPLAVDGGWRAVPIEAGEKGPRLKGWPGRGVPTTPEVAAWAAKPGANMGLVLGVHENLPENEHVVAVDMDVTDPTAARAVLDIVRRYVPDAPLRTGNPAKPGAVFVRVCAEPGDSPTLRQGGKYRFADTPEGKTEQVEMLGAGRQAVIRGMHPAGVPYAWESGRGIPEIRVAELPSLSVAQAAKMIAECDAAIEAAGGVLRQAGRVSGERGGSGEAYLPELNESAARKLLTGLEQTANDLDRDEWIAFVKAVHTVCAPALGEEIAFAALLRFTDRWEAAPEGADPELLRRAIHEGRQLESYGLRNLVRVMRERGWTAGAGFLAQLDFSDAPPANDNDMPGATDDPPRPVLLQDADIAGALDAFEASVTERGLPLYQRGGPVMVARGRYRDRCGREVSGSALHMMTVANLTEFASRHFDVRRPGRKGSEVPAILSHQLAAAYLDRGQWRLPTIGALVQAPILARSGRIVSAPGFDPESGVFVADTLTGFTTPDTSDWRTETDARRAARAALTLLAGLFSHYRFATPADRSVALAALLTPFAVHAGVRGPLFAFNGTGPGVGKSKLVDAIAVLLTGARAQAMTQGVSAAEFEKHMLGKVLEGASLLNIDNVEQPLEGDTLNAVLTQERLSIRPLGTSRTVTVEHRLTLYATGNNLVVRGDMARRVLTCRIDPGVERPELRTFPFDPAERAAAERTALVSAALTVLAAHAHSGFPGMARLTTAYGSFEEWSRYVRAALVWLGEADPLDVTAGLREADPVLTRLGVVLDALVSTVGLDVPFGARDIVPGSALTEFVAADDGDAPAPRQVLGAALREALAEERIGRGLADAAGIGRYLGRNEGRVVNGLRLDKARSDAKRGHLYRVSRAADANPHSARGGSGG
ncbi:Bifunctional DNA primase/polymerase, N-terminal [Methylobacterium sp. UNC378MF]|nr:Bifunctional DNA primase/polymerase, N-terminal [Methylobacterium sp. UNC378MF]